MPSQQRDIMDLRIAGTPGLSIKRSFAAIFVFLDGAAIGARMLA